MRVVLDANVIVSAAFRHDTDPDTLIRIWLRGDFDLVTSEPLLSELNDVLRRPHIRPRLNWSTERITDFLGEVARQAVVVEPHFILTVVRDDNDNRVLEAAVEGEADYIVSNDDDLLVLGEYEGIQIVTPARFVAILANTDL
jgi:putative PIN family toxin of toxin-antitoxin system